MLRAVISLALVAAILGAGSVFDVSGTSAQCSSAPGTPVQLAGTPHLFVADDDGVLHWAGDTRALAGHTVNWGSQCSVSLAELSAARRGDPWLSAGLPKIGDAIYLAKWEDSASAPTLLHIQSIADMELFGINGANYASFVMEQAPWEQRYGFTAAYLPVGVLATASSFSWSDADRASYAQLLSDLGSAESAALGRAAGSGADAPTTLNLVGQCERQALDAFERDRAAAAASLQGATDCLGRIGGGAAALPSLPQPGDLQRLFQGIAPVAGTPVGLQPGAPTALPATLTAGVQQLTPVATVAPGASEPASTPVLSPTPSPTVFVPRPLQPGQHHR